MPAATSRPLFCAQSRATSGCTFATSSASSHPLPPNESAAQSTVASAAPARTSMRSTEHVPPISPSSATRQRAFASCSVPKVGAIRSKRNVSIPPAKASGGQQVGPTHAVETGFKTRRFLEIASRVGQESTKQQRNGRPQRDSNSCYSLERAVSWAWLDDGDGGWKAGGRYIA